MTNIIETIEIVSEALKRELCASISFTGFLKAFDKVPHHLLIIKLEASGIKGILLRWLTDFLTGRKQRIVFGESKSSWTENLSGVSQGSV